MSKEKILVTGANGQIGTVLTKALQDTYGAQYVVASDIRQPATVGGLFELVDVLRPDQLEVVVEKHGITRIYHLAAILSAKGETHPKWAWEVNMNGLLNVFETARKKGVRQVFYPSSIAVFGKNAPKKNTPQQANLTPATVYGISKVAGELWCNYYFNRYGLDIRSLRYPGVVGYQSLPGGGTTDYAVDIFHYAVKGRPYPCFLKEKTALPMIYMDDAIRATIELMEAPAESITVRTSYNLSGMSFTPSELADSIKTFFPDFKIIYQPDERQQIADSWPDSIDDSLARRDWHWQPAYDLPAMTADMIEHLVVRTQQNIY
ncbi:MAG TPA: NAD-dependent epimerase/dehydratase family protein [Bacteroidetes bacterium]|nr:NAD-dependent epimerase/dehydratase family protein [Bacteroidota bacterium]